MRNIILMILLLASTKASYAKDVYLCDGFKVNSENESLEQIPNSKFEITRSSLGLEIVNKQTNQEWSAYKEIQENFYQDGNIILGMGKKNNETRFVYTNTENKQSVAFMNCSVPKEF